MKSEMRSNRKRAEDSLGIFFWTMMLVNIIFANLLSLAGGVAIGKVSVGSVGDEQITDPEEIAHFTTSPPDPVLDDWEDWDSWVPPAEIIKWFPYYKSGYDHDGLAVYVMEFGKWNYRELARKPEELQEVFWKHFEQLLRRITRDAEVNSEQGVAYVLDWDSFNLGYYASPKALQLALKMFTAMRRFNHAIKYGIMINTNFGAETFLNIARPFMGNILGKFDIYGTHNKKWKPMLLRKIPAKSLPVRYGGVKEWTPIPFTSKQ